MWSLSKDGHLCVKCGHLGHIASGCTDSVLRAWEQSYLKELVFGYLAQVNFASAGFGDFLAEIVVEVFLNPGVLNPRISCCGYQLQ